MNNCLECGNPTNNAKFCSRSCSAIFNHKVKKSVHIDKLCAREGCHNILVGKRQVQKYCCFECSTEHNKQILLNRFLAGENISDSQYGVPRSIRSYLLDQANHACTKCGWSKIHPTLGIVPLDINHIDGDATNNHKDNLEVLCKNCHSLTPNYGRLNKTSTRTYRYPKN